MSKLTLDLRCAHGILKTERCRFCEAADPRCMMCGDPKSKHTKSDADWRTVPGCTGVYWVQP